jgi:hypothetical protein
MDEVDKEETKEHECLNPGCGKTFTDAENGAKECTCHAANTLRMNSIIDSRYKLWKHLMAIFGLRTSSTGPQYSAQEATMFPIAEVKKLLPDLNFGFDGAGTLLREKPPASGVEEDSVTVSMDPSTWPTVDEVAKNKAAFPPSIYSLLVWTCCERPYTPGADSNGCKKTEHKCEVRADTVVAY